MEEEPWVEDPSSVEKSYSAAASRAREIAARSQCPVRVVRSFRFNDKFTVEIPVSLYKVFIAEATLSRAINECEQETSVEVRNAEEAWQEATAEFHRIYHPDSYS